MLGWCSIHCMMYSVYAALGICGTQCMLYLVLAMGPSDLPVARAWTTNTGLCRPRPVQKPDLLCFGRPNPDQHPCTPGFWRVWLDLSVPISGSAFWVSLFIVAFRYATVNRELWTLVHHCLMSIYWPPWWSKPTETCALQHPENECQRSVTDCWLCILGNLGGCRLYKVRNEALAAFVVKRDCETLSTPSWEWASMEHQRFLVVQLR